MGLDVRFVRLVQVRRLNIVQRATRWQNMLGMLLKRFSGCGEDLG
jgi:hypothetical protein